MMLVQLPAMDVVSVSVSVPAFPSLNLGFAHILVKPSTWLVLLVSMVILSSIRAAFLLVRPHTWTEGRKSVSFVTIVKDQSASKPVGVPSGNSPDGKGNSTIPAPTTEGRKTSSWLWGIFKWDTLPAVPLQSEPLSRGWQPPPSTAKQMQQTHTQQTRRPSNHPPSAIYDTQVPVSMAKMIMSRHTFRRPTSRPPPVRATNVPQYQRKTPSMV